MIKKGICLYNNGIINIEKQISINSGVEVPCNTSTVKYTSNAFVPKKDWKNPTKEDLTVLITKKRSNPTFKSVAVGTLPIKISSLIKKIQLSECKTLFDIDPKFKENENILKIINKELNLFLRTRSSNQKFKFHRITKGQPDNETTTFHFINKEFVTYIGLHIDESRIFTPHSAYKSDNRISINISNESRYLFFINLTLKQIMNMDIGKNITTSNIVENFLKKNPDYPVVRIELKPYQYYIAPTDNFIHDGSTLGNKDFDITIVYVGNFDNY